MYVPSYYRESNTEKILAFVKANSFGALISFDGEKPIAAHLPFLIEQKPDGEIILAGHIARANEQWRGFDLQKEVLTIFTGAHAYISPRWYDEPTNHVPTWNYQAVHIYGKPRIIENADEVFSLLKRMVERFEPENTTYRVETIAPETMKRLSQGIVAFEIAATRIEAAFKLAQKLNDESFAGVVTALDANADENSRGVAAAMRESRNLSAPVA